MLTEQTWLDKHEVKVVVKDNLTFCVWQDTKAAVILTAISSRRKGQQGEGNKSEIQPRLLL